MKTEGAFDGFDTLNDKRENESRVNAILYRLGISPDEMSIDEKRVLTHNFLLQRVIESLLSRIEILEHP